MARPLRWTRILPWAPASLLLVPGAPLAAQSAGADSGALLAPGISQALARHRAGTIADVRYDLSLDLTARDSATGRVTVRLKRSGPDDLVLDFRGRRLANLVANGAPVDPDIRDGHIVIPARLLRSGENTLALGFVADIAPSGAAIIRAHDTSDGSDYLYTLFVPADASQLFPCFDQPDLKARVRLTLATPAAWTVVANGPVESADSAGGRRTTRFAPTASISTYLIAFAAGPWRQASATVRGRTITAYVRRSRAGEADLDTLLALNHRALAWMERWFGRPYPFGKFDFVLAPAFPFGGMEHPGAVFYSEDRFIFRERPTLPRRLARFSTILHEAAHQWFGDLVTMRWFDDLWLKEGFATFMAAKALADLEPGADAWKTFYLGNKPSAYAVDQTAGTRPLWQALDNLAQAKSNYGAIVYNKAPGVLKQLEYLVGERAFQAGLRRFLARHAFANATWQDLLKSVGTAAGRPLDGFGREFMVRAGMPVVTQRLVVRGGRIARLELAQRPAAVGIAGDSVPPTRSSVRQLWTERAEVLLAYRGRKPVRLPVELRGPVTRVAAAVGMPAPEFVFANAGDYGYFLLLLDSVSVAALEGGALGRVRDGFLRAMLWGALWDQVRASEMPPERFVRLALQELPSETDEQIVPVVLARLTRAVGAYLMPEARARLQEDVERTLWEGGADPRRAYGVLKEFVDAFIDVAASPEGYARLAGLLSADSVAGEPLRDPTRWDVVTVWVTLGGPGAERAFEHQRARDTMPDGRRLAFIAGAARGNAATKREYFHRYFTDSTLNEEWASGSLGPFNALEHEGLTLPYIGPALDSLPFIQGQTSDTAASVARGYLDAHPALPLDLRRKVLQYLDELERTVRIRAGAVRVEPPYVPPVSP